MFPRRLQFISGLYFYVRNGKIFYPHKIIKEIEISLQINSWYKEKLICYTDSKEMAKLLQNKGLYVHKVFDDAPESIKINAAHKMKHWIVLNAIKEFNDVVWLDWDTYSVKPVDDLFIQNCLSSDHPKFTFIKNYWAKVNCSVYYSNANHISLMEKSFDSIVSEPNDELLWKSVLPDNIEDLKEYWFDDLVVNIWNDSDFKNVTNNTYFLHVRDFKILQNFTNLNCKL
jgi:hypothetical protein